jgi:copper(I)-binding protein
MRIASLRPILLAIAAASLVLPAVAAAQSVEVKDAWTRATAPGQKAGGVFMQLRSAQGAAVVSAQSPVATTVEIHEMSMDGNVMRMRAIPKLDLPAGQTVELKPGGYHVMLIDLKQPLKKGEKVPVTLRVEGKDRQVQEVAVQAEVRDMTAGTEHGGQSKH